ncbi:MAG: tetratricopeptide repeat protein [Acidobacteriota bacterium]
MGPLPITSPLNRNGQAFAAGVLLSAFLFQLPVLGKPPDDAAAHYKQGLESFDKGEYERAEMEFRKAAQLAPTRPEPHLYLGRIAGAKGQPAEPSFQKAIDLNPGFSEAHHSLGVYYLQHGSLAQARKSLEKATNLSPGTWVFHLDLGTACLNLSDYATARQHFEETIRLAGKDRTALFAANFNLGLVCRAAGDQAGALNHFQKAESLSAPRIDLALTLSDLYQKVQQPARAREALLKVKEILRPSPEQTLSLGHQILAGRFSPQLLNELEKLLNSLPQSFEVAHCLGVVFFKQAEWERAEQAFRRALSLKGDQPQTYFLLGKLYAHSERTKALAALEQCLEMAPGHDAAWRDLTNLLLADERFDEAVRRLEGLTARFPDRAFPRVLLAEACFAASQVVRAERELEKAVELDPYSFAARYRLGFVLRFTGRSKEASKQIEQALQLQPQNALANLEMGELQLEEGRYSQAQEHFQQAIRSREDLPDAHFRLGQVYLLQQKYTESVAALQRATELAPRHAQSYYLLSRAYRGLKDDRQADAAFETFRRMEQDEPAQAKRDRPRPIPRTE